MMSITSRKSPSFMSQTSLSSCLARDAPVYNKSPGLALYGESQSYCTQRSAVTSIRVTASASSPLNFLQVWNGTLVPFHFLAPEPPVIYREQLRELLESTRVARQPHGASQKFYAFNIYLLDVSVGGTVGTTRPSSTKRAICALKTAIFLPIFCSMQERQE